MKRKISAVLKEPKENGDDITGTDIKDASSESTSTSVQWRSGKWTIEEEKYAEMLIEYFNNGQLALEPNDGRTLRSFLSHRLNCNPMRISKKFATIDGLSARYQRIEYSNERIQANKRVLEAYEIAFKERDQIVQMNREKRRQYRSSSLQKSNNQDHVDGSKELMFDELVGDQLNLDVFNNNDIIEDIDDFLRIDDVSL